MYGRASSWMAVGDKGRILKNRGDAMSGRGYGNNWTSRVVDLLKFCRWCWTDEGNKERLAIGGKKQSECIKYRSCLIYSLNTELEVKHIFRLLCVTMRSWRGERGDEWMTSWCWQHIPFYKMCRWTMPYSRAWSLSTGRLWTSTNTSTASTRLWVSCNSLKGQSPIHHVR